MASTFAGAWRHRRWRWLLASFAVSSVGDYLYFVALAVFLIESTGSAAWIAAAAIARLTAYAVLGPFGGAVADRYDRRRLMVVLDLVRAVLMVVLAAIAWSDGPPVLAIGLTVLNAVASTPFRPAIVAATPVLVEETDLAAANAAESVVGQIAFFLGPALGALAVTIAGAGSAFLINGMTFAVSALLLVRIGSAGGGVASDANDGGSAGDETKAETTRAQISEGVRVVRNDPGLVALIAFTSAVVFFLGFEQVVHVLVATDRLGMSASGIGVLGAAIGIGGLAVAPFTARLGGGANAGRMLVASGLMMGIPMALLAVISSPALAIVVLLVEGMGMIAFEVLFITLLQRATPEAALARVYGLQDSVTAVAQLLGSLAVPILIAAVGLESSLVVGAAVMVGATALLARPLTRLAQRTDAVRRQHAPTVDLLRSLGIFGDAPHAALERLARASRRISVPAGTEVFHEGDHPDDLYVVVAGTVTVSAATLELGRLGEGQWFGEVGLVHAAPRNATVTAADDLELIAIPGPVFLDALTHSEAMPDPLRMTVTARVGSSGSDAVTLNS